METKQGWLKDILDDARRAVEDWPTWRRSHEFESELAKLDEQRRDEKLETGSARPALEHK